MRRLYLAFTLVLHSIIWAGSTECADQPPSLRLPETVAPVGYRAELTLDPNREDFSGFIRINVKISAPVQTIWLNGTDLDIAEASFQTGGKTYVAKAAKSGTDFIGLEFGQPLAAADGELSIHYSAKLRQKDTSGAFRSEDNGNRYIFTQFEATDARAAFPCFDEPSFKTPWQLTLHVPTGDTAISNTPAASEEQDGGTKTYVFKETKPIPSYLVAFGVGPFEYVDAGTAGSKHVPVRIVTPKGHADEAQYAAKVTATILTRLEDYFGIPYPYDKSDNVAVPLFGGAMENPGMVTYGQTIILGNPARDSTGRQRGYVDIAAHELAHQWFGDLVTTAWWNDIWLNEAFATWMADKLVSEWKPEWQVDVAQVGGTTQVKREDGLPAARMIRQEIKKKDDIDNAFDGITYVKGAAVIGMFESYLGREDFRKGVQSYLKQHAFGNATAPEFLDAISSATHKNITKAFSTFLNQPGVPLVGVTLDCKRNVPTLHLEQERFAPLGLKRGRDELWQIPVCVRYGTGDVSYKDCTMLTQPQQDWELKTASCPAWVQANENAAGYYQVDYRGDLLPALMAGNVEKRLTARERVDLLGNTGALLAAGKLASGKALGIVEIFHDDPERFVVERALDLALAPEQHLVPASLKPRYQAFLQKNFGARASTLGWQAKTDEPDNVRLLRPRLVRVMATSGGDRELADQARVLTDGWFQNHASLDPNLVSAVLDTAAYHGDKGLFDRFLAEFQKTHDRLERERLLQALSSFRDPAAVQAAKQLLLSGEISFAEGGYGLLFAGKDFPPTSKLPFEFLRDHYEDMLAKRTGGVFDIAAFFPNVGDSLCDGEEEAEYKSFFEPRVDKLLGARHTYAEVLEDIKSCIAFKAEQGPGVAEFLGK